MQLSAHILSLRSLGHHADLARLDHGRTTPRKCNAGKSAIAAQFAPIVPEHTFAWVLPGSTRLQPEPRQRVGGGRRGHFSPRKSHQAGNAGTMAGKIAKAPVSESLRPIVAFDCSKLFSSWRTLPARTAPTSPHGPKSTAKIHFARSYHTLLGSVIPPAMPGGHRVPAERQVDRKFAKLVEVVASRQIAGQTVGDRWIFDWALDPATCSLFPAD
jgi:hypothetical protein